MRLWSGKRSKAQERKARRKGQYTIVEIIILFGIGFMILTGLVSVFGSMNARLATPLQTLQLEEVANYIAARANDLVKLDDGSSVTITVPEKVAGVPYTIFAEGKEEVIVYTTGGVEGGLFANKSLPVAARGIVGSGIRNVQLIYVDGALQIREAAYY